MISMLNVRPKCYHDSLVKDLISQSYDLNIIAIYVVLIGRQKYLLIDVE